MRMNVLKGYYTPDYDFPFFKKNDGWHFTHAMKFYGPFNDKEAAQEAYRNLLNHEGEAA